MKIIVILTYICAFSAFAQEVPTLLYEKNYEHGRTGMTWGEAKKTCERKREENNGTFFYVFCDFHQKNWIELMTGFSTYTSYEVIGYMTETEVLVNRRGRSERTVESPTIVSIEIPYSYQYEQVFNVYGIRIFGWGKLGSAKEKRIFTSDGSNKIYTRLSFPTALYALEECQLFKLKFAQRDTRFYRTWCETRPSNEGDFYFDIMTFNPFIKDDLK